MPYDAIAELAPRDRPLPELGAPLPAGTVIVSPDSHAIEPPEIVDRMPPRFRDRIRVGWDDEEGFHFVVDGSDSLVDRVDARNKELGAADNFRRDVIDGRPGMRDWEARLADLDAEGVDKELIFPQRSLEMTRAQPDREFVAAYQRAYNQTRVAYTKTHPDRFYNVALVNFWDPGATRDEIQMVKAMGMKALTIPIAPVGVEYNDPKMEPMWDAFEEGGIPVSFHVGEGLVFNHPGAMATRLMMTFSPYRRLWSLLTFSGVLERHPKLKVVFTEGGISWIAAALQDADRFVPQYRPVLDVKLAHPPSWYWFQNCYATFMEDAIGLAQLDLIGWDRVMWAGDYPHPESTVGYMRETVWDVFRATTPEKAQAIVGGTAMKIWDL